MQRRTVVLRHWLGLSIEETAAELGIGIGTVKSLSSRRARSPPCVVLLAASAGSTAELRGSTRPATKSQNGPVR